MNLSNSTKDNTQFVRKMIEHASKLVLNDNPIDTIKEITDYMIEKEKQDKIWNELSEEKKEKYSKEYKEAMDDCGESTLIERRELLTEIFGSHNLNPEPQIKTWEDMEKGSYKNMVGYLSSFSNDIKLNKKLAATFQIKLLIDLGYGGMVSEEEWKDDSMEKFKITPFKNGGFQVVRYYSIQHKDILSFRDRKIAEEFMSHESNRSLVRDYYLMEKGEGV